MLSDSTASIELSPRRPARIFSLARFRLARFLGVKSALLAAPNPPVCPQSFENHFRCGRRAAGILAILNSEPPDVLHKALNLRELLIPFGRGRKLREFQLAAQL